MYFDQTERYLTKGLKEQKPKALVKHSAEKHI